MSVSTATTYGTDCVTMLHLDGTDGSTTFTDDSASGHTFNANGDAQLDTADKKFGSASLLLDGTGDYIDSIDSSDWVLTGDFTIDMWAKWNVFGTQGFCGQGDASNNRWSFNSNNGVTGLSFSQFHAATTPTNDFSDTQTGTLASGSWIHVAIVRNGNNFQLFQDGTELGTTQTSSITMQDFAATLQVGAVRGGIFFNGWIDEVRIVKGTAVWTSNFTPPSAAYTPTATGGLLKTHPSMNGLRQDFMAGGMRG